MHKTSKERLFISALVALPVVLLLTAEMGLRLSGFAETRRDILKPIENKDGWVGVNPEYPGRYFRGFLPAVAFTPFRSPKPADGIRVVVLGGSSTAGFPYQWYHGFPAFLEQRLTDSYPDRPLEVINLGMTAVNSYTLWDLSRHVSAMDPDLVVVYAGHNEFYGAFGAGTTGTWYPKGAWFGRAIVTLKRSLLVQALEYLILGPPDYGLNAGANERTLMARVVQDAGIVFGGSVYEAGLEQFRSNMSRVLDHFERERIPVLAATLTANLREQHPLSQTEDAVAAFEQAHRELAAGDTAAAATLFHRARDLDQIRFRAPSAVNEIIRSWGERRNVTVVDMEATFSQASATGIPGYDLFTDHLHPTAEGYELMAASMAPAAVSILSEGGLEPRPLVLDWDHTMIDGLAYSEAGILIDRLLSDYPFNLEGDPASARTAYEALLNERQRSGLLADSLALAVMATSLNTQNALLQGAGLHEMRKDSAEALRYYYALFNWQPFNEKLMEEIIGRYLPSSSWDAELEKMALFGANRTDGAYFWNALAVTQIRQERWRAAAVALSEAERISPSSPVMLYNRARLELALGDTAAARATLQAYRQSQSGRTDTGSAGGQTPRQ